MLQDITVFHDQHERAEDRDLAALFDQHEREDAAELARRHAAYERGRHALARWVAYCDRRNLHADWRKRLEELPF